MYAKKKVQSFCIIRIIRFVGQYHFRENSRSLTAMVACVLGVVARVLHAHFSTFPIRPWLPIPLPSPRTCTTLYMPSLTVFWSNTQTLHDYLPRPGLVKGQWSREEDELLMSLVNEGHKNWGTLASRVPGRTSKQCRERWCHHLDPRIVKGDWTEEEDQTIVAMHAEIGNKWATIAQVRSGLVLFP